jgi:uncharacterized protein with FMN-binding domain
MPKKMPGRLVALSASAVATIYLAGLLSTQTAAQNVAAASAGADTAVVATPSSTLTANGVNPASLPSVVVGASASATSASSASGTPVATSTPTGTAPATTSAAASTSTYANGTYAATGTSRFGNVSVSVTISGGKIANVQIAKTTTSFPVARIASLPAQVLQTQTANVSAVTGATYSSQAFKQAVQQALAQALAANSTTAAG